MRNRESFNEAADVYDKARPSYPDEIIDWIIEHSSVKSDSELLEIAPGTGQCTRKFAERGYKIHCIELGDKLAELLMKNMKEHQVTVDVSPFEDWVPSKRTYPLIYCATAWHWIDREVKYGKTADLLQDDGRLAILWNTPLGAANNKVMDEAYKILFSYHKETPHSIKPKTKDEVSAQEIGTKQMLEESGHYHLDGYHEKEWSVYQPRENVIDGFYSQSSFLSLPLPQQEDLKKRLTPLFNQLNENEETYFKSVVYLLKKT